jgi:hypothetical protein
VVSFQYGIAPTIALAQIESECTGSRYSSI